MDDETRRDLLICGGTFLAVVAFEVRFYPILAEAVDGLLGGKGGPGSSIGYFRDLYVLPWGALFAALAIAGLCFAARRGQQSLRRTAVVVLLLNLVALCVSSTWYLHTIRAGGGYRG